MVAGAPGTAEGRQRGAPTAGRASVAFGRWSPPSPAAGGVRRGGFS